MLNGLSLSLMNKALKFSLLNNKSYNVGELVNLLQVDSYRLVWVMWFISDACFLPIQLAFGIF